MSGSIHLDLTSITGLLGRWLSRHVAKEGLTWLGEKREQISGGAPERVFFTAFSAVPRYTGKKSSSEPASLASNTTARLG